MSRLTLLAMAAAVLALAATARAETPTPGAPAGYSWKPLKTGAGGWITGLSLAADGSVVYGRADTGGAFRWDEATKSWTQIVTALSVPAEDVKLDEYEGVLSIAAAPSDSHRAYMAWEHGINRLNLYRSDDRGDHWTKTGLPVLDEGANSDGRHQGERIAVDPANADHVLYGSSSAGLFQTRDGGKTWARVAAIPVSDKTQWGVGNVVFDPGHAGTIYATVQDHGVYASRDGGATWAKLDGGPADPGAYQHAVVDRDGRLYVTKPGEAGLWRYAAGAWMRLAPQLSGLNSVAVDPRAPNRIFVFDGGGTPWRSVDGGNSFVQLDKTRTADDIPWLGWTDESYMSTGNVLFDPKVPGRLWFAQGIGVWRAEPSDSDSAIRWQSVNTGIEQLVTNDVIVPPGGKAVTASWDRAIFYHEDNDAYPARHGPTSRFNSGWDLDYAYHQPNFIVATVYDHRRCCSRWSGPDNQSGYSTDGGRNWTVFPAIAKGTLPADLTFGDIAVASTDTNDIVWLPTGDKPAYYTTDRGATWQATALPGSHPGFYMHRHVLAADTVRDRTFYILGQDHGRAAVSMTTDGGAHWTTRPAEGLDAADITGNATLKAVPGQAGALCVSYGFRSSDRPMACSTDAGAHWRAIANAAMVNVFAFGAPAPGHDGPTLYVQGKVGGDAGVFCSVDMGAHWGRLARWPLGYTTGMSEMDADKVTFGRVYAGIEGNGWMYGVPSLGVGAELCNK